LKGDDRSPRAADLERPLRVLAPQFGGDRLFVAATRFDPDTLVSFPRVSSFFGSSDGIGVITDEPGRICLLMK